MIEIRNYGTVPTLETRHDAYISVDKQKRYSQIVDCLVGGPMTAKEIAVCMFRKGEIPTSERNFTAPRLTELSKQGVVEPMGKKVCSYTGKKVTVFQLRSA